MSDSFFGFDTAIAAEDDDGEGGDDGRRRGRGGGNGHRTDGDSEDEYDALNDETFGQAREDDWEDLHENLVRMDQREGGDGDSERDSDLDFNFSTMGIDNFELDNDTEPESRLQLDPSVWRMTSKAPEVPPRPPMVMPIAAPVTNRFLGMAPRLPMISPGPMRICSLQEIEQSMIKQQQHHQQLQHPQHQQDTFHQFHPALGMPRPPPGFSGVPGMVRRPLSVPVTFPPPTMIPPPIPLLPTTSMPPPGQPPLFPINHPPPPLMNNNLNASFSQRLVEEIQQNHPMLPHNRQQQQQLLQQQHQHNNYNKQHQQHHQHGNRGYGQQGHANNHRLQNGKINRHYEYDEYADLMSERDKQWLLGIQLTQLNKETSFYNDYYFCVFRDRKERERGAERESKAHKDNTFYHPFTQHLLNRNGLIRERRNSDNKDIKEIPPRNYTPLQFENSLGKLQCGSVTAPRKIIDQDVVAERAANDNGTIAPGSEVLTQRRSRQVLLHVENLYRLVLRLEDLANPLAIEAKQQMRERRDRDQLLALEKASTDEMNNVAVGGGQQPVPSVAPPPQTAASEVLQDTFDGLLEKVALGLTPEGVLRIMSVRKGKLLLERIQRALTEHPFRWTVWCTVVSSLVALPKRDREDPDNLLRPLYMLLEQHLRTSTVADLLSILDTLLNTDQLLALVPKSKFLLSVVLMLIARLEQLTGGDGFGTDIMAERWLGFLRELSRAISSVSIGPQKVLLKLEANCGILSLLRTHFRRHPELDLELKLSALISVVEQ